MPEENNNSVMLIDLASLFSKSGTSLEMIVVVNKVFDQKHLFLKICSVSYDFFSCRSRCCVI